MHFTRFSLLSLFLLAASIVPAQAQGYAKDRPMVSTQHLQQTEFYHHRLFIRVDDNSPIVTYGPQPQAQGPLVIPMQPRQSGTQAPAGTVPIGNGMYVIPVANPAGLNSTNPMLGNRYLPDAGPQSYISKRPVMAARDLPNGFTTGLHGVLKAPPHTVTPAIFQPASKAAFQNLPGEPLALKYSGPNTSIGGSTARRTTTDTSIKLLMKQK